MLPRVEVLLVQNSHTNICDRDRDTCYCVRSCRSLRSSVSGVTASFGIGSPVKEAKWLRTSDGW